MNAYRVLQRPWEYWPSELIVEEWADQGLSQKISYARYVPESSITELKEDNAKLRELVRELYQCSRQYGCDRCGYKDGCAMFDRMAQLGIEVDG